MSKTTYTITVILDTKYKTHTPDDEEMTDLIYTTINHTILDAAYPDQYLYVRVSSTEE
jgi:hypothetical protein